MILILIVIMTLILFMNLIVFLIRILIMEVTGAQAPGSHMSFLTATKQLRPLTQAAQLRPLTQTTDPFPLTAQLLAALQFGG